MWWFRKDKPSENEEIKWPIGDIEAANRIRNICRRQRRGGGPLCSRNG